MKTLKEICNPSESTLTEGLLSMAVLAQRLTKYRKAVESAKTSHDKLDNLARITETLGLIGIYQIEAQKKKR